MKLRVLGCSGGIGGNLHTTSFLLDHDVLIDAGTGLCELSLAELSLIDHVFVTHSHLDHIACIPFMVDSVGFMRDKPLIVHASAATIQTLQKHIFNWKVWPDFTGIPDVQHPYLHYEILELGQTVQLNGRKITPIPANHVVPAFGYHLESAACSLVFSGDTTTCDILWETVNRISNLKYLIVETAFSNSEMELAVTSKHYCPSLLAADLLKLKSNPEIFITHLKPGEIELTMQEVIECVKGRSPKMLLNGQVFEF